MSSSHSLETYPTTHSHSPHCTHHHPHSSRVLQLFCYLHQHVHGHTPHLGTGAEVSDQRGVAARNRPSPPWTRRQSPVPDDEAAGVTAATVGAGGCFAAGSAAVAAIGGVADGATAGGAPAGATPAGGCAGCAAKACRAIEAARPAPRRRVGGSAEEGRRRGRPRAVAGPSMGGVANARSRSSRQSTGPPREQWAAPGMPSSKHEQWYCSVITSRRLLCVVKASA